jgi:hypothetical protein
VHWSCQKLVLSTKDKVTSDNHLVSGTSASESVAMDTGVHNTETEPISDQFADVKAGKMDY